MPTNERPTKEITTERGNTFVMYEYITGRDKRSIESVYLNDAQISTKAGGGKKGEVDITGVSGAVNHRMQDASFRAVIVSVLPTSAETAITDKNKIIDFILDLPENEYNEIVKAINTITDPTDEDEEEKKDGATL